MPDSTTRSRAIPTEEKIYLSPRVVDQRAFQGFAAELREIIVEARDTVGSVAETVGDARETRAELAKESAGQREQARVGARLLKALTAKEASLESLLGRADGAAERLGSIDAVAASLDARIDEIVRERVEARLGALTESLDRLESAQAGIERRADVARENAKTATQRLERAGAEADARLGALSEVLAGSTDVVDDLERRAAALAADVERSRERLSTADRTAAKLDEAREAAEERLERFAGVASETGALLDALRSATSVADASLRSLEPWRALLEDDEGLPAPLAGTVERFRTAITQDLATMAEAMGAVAKRAESLASQPPRPDAPRAPQIVVRMADAAPAETRVKPEG